MIYHIRADGVNDHVFDWNGGPGIPAGYTRTAPPEHGADQHAVWNGSQWVVLAGPVPPLAVPVIVPNIISMRQCRLQLLAMDLLDDIDAAVGSMDRAAQIEWEYANDVTRGFPLVVAMQQLLGMTDEDVDQFFTEAAKL
jgi:hypothetical protein